MRTVARSDRLSIGAITSSESPDTASGLIFGAEEGERSAALFGRKVEIVTATAVPDAAAATREVLARGVALVVSGVPEAPVVRDVSALCRARGTWLINAASSAESLRDDACRHNLLHVVASDAMYAAAKRLGGNGSVTMWHAALDRFGAGQLNARYRARFSRDMTGEAWAGWMSMKLVVESFLRAGAADAKSLVGYALRADTRFDGHKGVPLSFRQSDHQLRQPLYVIAADGNVSPVPSGTAIDQETGDPLDALLGDPRTPCR